MTITTFIDPAKLPNQSQDQATFDNFMAQFYAQLPSFGNQVNAEVAAMNTRLASLNALLAGGAYVIPYVFKVSGNIGLQGGLGFDGPGAFNLNAATGLFLDLVDAQGSNVAALLESFNASTSAAKGQILVCKQGDRSKWVLFNLTSVAAPGNYRFASVTAVAASAPNPFAVGESLMLFFQRTGDKGDTGLQGLNGRSWVLADTGLIAGNPVNIDYLNVFSDSYDSYTIEYEAVRPSASSTGLLLKFAVGGALTTGTVYSAQATASNGNLTVTPTSRDYGEILVPSVGIGTALGVIGRTHIRNARNGAANAYTTMEQSVISAAGAGAYMSSLLSVAQLGNKASGFRLYWAGGQAFAGGRIRVIGHRNS